MHIAIFASQIGSCFQDTIFSLKRNEIYFKIQNLGNSHVEKQIFFKVSWELIVRPESVFNCNK